MLLLILNFSSILWTKVGIFLHELSFALSNEYSKHQEFHNGLAKTLENLSYALPFLVLLLFLIIVGVRKPHENNEHTTGNDAELNSPKQM